MASGNTNGYELSTFGEAGYDFHFGNFSVGPIGSLQYTSIHVDGYSERGSFLPLNIHSDSEESLRTDLVLGFADNLQRCCLSGSYGDGLRPGRRP
jgi:outer membrane autotransporter protein